MAIRPHSDEWYDQLETRRTGYPSTTEDAQVDTWSGEAAYLQLVKDHLGENVDVLDAGCGHGDVAVELASLCRSIIAYDRVEGFIELARENARKHNASNVTFMCANSSASANHGEPRMPVEDGSVDLVISRRGPLHWIADARRVLRSGGILIQLCMLGRRPVPDWNDLLPEPFRRDKWDLGHLPDSMLESVQQALDDANIALQSCWTFDVPALIADPRVLYRSLSIGMDPREIPVYEDVAGSFEAVFAEYGRQGRLDVRERRLLWKAVIS